MEKIDTRTPDFTEENIAKLTELFPQVATEVASEEGLIKKAIDFDALRDLLGDVAEGQRERYQFTWPGKREAKAEARRPIDKTMIPCPDKSVDWDTTENLYIEGDNLDALKLLKETYAGKIKLIYIDPPYNTGHDFIYDDDFVASSEEYKSGETSDEGRLVANPESNGRFHSDWCSMMYPRLLLARDLLSKDGVILVSIGENEVVSLRKIMDELFGTQSSLGSFVWKARVKPANVGAAKYRPQKELEYVIAYEKTPGLGGFLPLVSGNQRSYPKELDGRRYRLATILKSNRGTNYRSTMSFESGGYTPPEGQRWQAGKEEIDRLFETGHIEFTSSAPMRRYFEDEEEPPHDPLYNFMSKEWTSTSEAGKEELNDLVGAFHGFDTVKPTRLIQTFAASCTTGDDTILDFFSGSGTTAHSIMLQNALDGQSRKYIAVQYPEQMDEKSRIGQDRVETIADLGEERIRRAGLKITEEIESSNHQLQFGEEPKLVPDVGFRVLRIESSNFKNTYLTPDNTDQASLLDAIDNVKDGRTPEDILFQVLPAFRIPYSAHIEKQDINGKKVFDVNYGQLLACFDIDVTNDVIEEIARRKPSYAVMRDLSFKDDSASANFEELFKTFSPDTIRRVI